VGVPELVDGVALAGRFAEDSVAHYYRVEIESGEHLVVALDDADDVGVNALYVSHGRVPTRADHDYQFARPEEADPYVLVPSPLPGTWYVLAYCMAGAGDYNIVADTTGVALADVAPERLGAAGSAQVALTGAGLDETTLVELVDPAGTPHAATAVSVESPTRLLATFDAGGLPLGLYDVRVSAGGDSAQLDGAVELLSGDTTAIRTNLVLPSRLGSAHTLQTFYVEYENTGDVAVGAPLLAVHATDTGVLTLDYNRATNAMVHRQDRTFPEGFSDTVYILASGDQPGVLLPGESGRVPVYWMGIADRAQDDGEVEITVQGLTAQNWFSVEWDEIEDDVRPPWVADDAWEVVWANYVAQTGSTWGDYVTMLDENAAYLGRLGVRENDVCDLNAFALRQADGLSRFTWLSGSLDAFHQVTGEPLVFPRLYPQPITRRYALGPFGRGWVHAWQITAETDAEGNVIVNDMTGTPRIFHASQDGGWFAAPGDSATLEAVVSGYMLTEADGTQYLFRSDGQLQWFRNSVGIQTNLVYDLDGRMVALERSSVQPRFLFTYNDAGLIATLTEDLPGPDDPVTTYNYDAANEHLISVEYPDGRVIRYDYYSGEGAPREHALKEIEFPDGSHQYFAYDDQGRLSEVHRDGGAETMTFAYGPAGKVVSTTADGAAAFYFGTRGELLGFDDPDGRSWRWAYDPDSNLRAFIRPDGFSYSYTRDWTGALLSVTDPMGNVTEFTPAHHGEELYNGIRDANGNLTVYEISPRGELAAVNYPGGARQAWAYDAPGEPRAWTNARGDLTRHHFGFGFLTRIELPEGVDVVYEFDDHGNLLSATNDLGTVAFDYDENDRLTRVAYPGGQSLEFGYDAAGRRTYSLDHLGNRINYFYDDVGRLWRLTDGAGREIARYTYDPVGRVQRKDLANGVNTTFAYDAGLLSSVVNRAPDGTVLSRFDYTYDDAGLCTSVATLEGTWTYRYDLDRRLTRATFASDDRATIPDQDIAYTYDPVGNRLSIVINGAETPYTPNARNQYDTVGTVVYEYDPDGNLIRRTDGADVTTYTYDSQNRLTQVTRGADTWTCAYDALGQRVSVTHNGVTTYLVYDPLTPGALVGAYEDDGDPLANYIHGLGLLARTDPTGEEAWYCFDGLGSTADLTDETGIEVNSYLYLPFGGTLVATEAVENDFEFLGEWGVVSDPTGLAYAQARYYDPALGRFLSRDPLGIGGGDVNLYTYGANNPVTIIDPFGQRWMCGRVYHSEHWTHSFGFSFGVSEGVSAGASIGGGVGVGASLGPSVVVGPAANAGVASAGAGLHAGAGVGVFAGVWSGASLGYSYGTTDGWFCGWTSDEESPPDPDDEDEHGPGPRDWDMGPGGGSGASAGTVRSCDPNAKNGPAGFGPPAFMRPGASMAYRIDFENDPSATAPAQHVSITDQLDPSLDWETFELTEVGFGHILIPITGGGYYFHTIVETSQNGQEIEVHVEVELDPDTGRLTATFATLDPQAGLPPDVMTGFLPPEDGTGRGMGHITYVVQSKPALATGTEIRNIANITFDFAETIATNQIDPHDPSQGTDPAKECLNTIDADPPTSQVTDLPAQSPATFTVSWGGDDGAGSGVATYDVYISTDGGPYALWLDDTPDTSATFTGQNAHTYAFYSVATDNVGHTEAAPPAADAQTQVVLDTRVLTPGSKTRSWTFTDSDGDLVTVTLGGRSGQAEIVRNATGPEQPGDILSITLDATDTRSSLAIRTRGRAETTVGDITVNGSLNYLSARTTDLLGDMTVTGTIRRLQFDDVADPHAITIGAPLSTRDVVTIRFDRAEDLSISSATPIRSLTATEWLDADPTPDQITAPWLGTLSIRGNRRENIPGHFQADLTLSGLGDPRYSLRSARIAGDLTNATWDITGNAGSVTVVGNVDAWTLDVHSDLRSLRLGDVATANVNVDGAIRSVQATRWQDGTLNARTIGSLYIRGNRRNAVPGDFGPTLTLSGDPDARRTINTARVAGSVSGTTWEITGDAGSLYLAGAVGNWTLNLHSNLSSLRLGDVANATVDVDGTIRRLMATRWQDGSLAARTIGSLHVRGDHRNAVPGDFGPTLTLSGDPDARRTINSARVAGSVSGTTWEITGDAGSLYLAGAVDNWTLNLQSSLSSLRLGDVATANVNVDGGIRSVQAARWQDGSLTAETIAFLYVRGDRRNGIPGDFSADLTLTGGSPARLMARPGTSRARPGASAPMAWWTTGP